MFACALKLLMNINIKRLHRYKKVDLKHILVEIMQGKKRHKNFHSTTLLYCFRIMYFCNMQVPKLPSFFKTSKHRQFDFKTRYYDAQKEDLDNRVKSTENSKTTLRFSKDWQQSKRSNENSTSNKRIILIVLILVLISFAILKI